MVLADEIHCDLTDPGCTYVPFASVSKDCALGSITCLSPTKTFNLAGIQTSAVVVPDPILRHKVWRGLNTDEAAEPNSFAVEAAIAAFKEGGPWLEALRLYLAENKARVREFVIQELPQLSVTESQATYLLWLNCEKISGNSEKLAQEIRRETGLWLSAGSAYKGEADCFLRMNVACPRQRLEEALQRLKRAIIFYEAWNIC